MGGSGVAAASGTVGALARASHPEPTVAVTGVSCALAVATGRSTSGVVLVGLAVLAGQLSVGWSNDYLDRARDQVTRRPDKPVAVGALPARLVGAAALTALVACVPASLASGLRPGIAHLAAVAAAWAYNLGAKATALSVVPYVVAFALLPVFVVGGLPGHPGPPWWLPVAGGCLGAGAHFANVLPDLADDERTGVRGLPHRLGATRARIAGALLLVAASALLVLGPWPPAPVELALAAAAVVLSVAGLAGRAGVTAFRAVMAVAVVDVALLLASGASLRP